MPLRNIYLPLLIYVLFIWCMSTIFSRPPLRKFLMDGEFFIGAALSVTLTKLALRYVVLTPDKTKQNVRSPVYFFLFRLQRNFWKFWNSGVIGHDLFRIWKLLLFSWFLDSQFIFIEIFWIRVMYNFILYTLHSKFHIFKNFVQKYN